MTDKRFFPRQVVESGGNRWDWALLPLVLALLVLLAWGGTQMARPYQLGEVLPLTLDPTALPYYLLRTTLRMFLALGASLLFACAFAALAAKYRAAERVLVPLLDILQSIPILGFLSITVTGFIALFPGNLFGVECAAIFAIFTSQAWNMAFSLYQSLRTVPPELQEASRVFQLSGWQRFWRLELPFAMPALLWNMMMSMSGGWFFVVASEAITVGNHTITLPGIGAYLAAAISEKNLHAIGWVILTMTVVILAYDQFLFRPLVAWSDKFRMENTSSGDAPESWLLDLIRRTRLIHRLLVPIGWMFAKAARVPIRWPSVGPVKFAKPAVLKPSRTGDIIWAVIVVLATAFVVYRVVAYVRTGVTLDEVGHVFVLGLITLLRVTVLIALASVVWLPIGVLIGLRPALAEKIQPVAQFLAAFPANLLFPVFVIVIVKFNLNPDIWLSPLIVLGTQWYILFNVIAGASAYPNDYREAAKNFRIRGWQWWRQAMLPGVFPYYVTGAITASGGAWNASIVAEAVQWGDTRLAAHGLGAYIAQYTAAGDYPKIILGIAVMSLFVSLFNRVLWRPLYAYAESRLRLD